MSSYSVEEPRRSPLVVSLVLWTAFALLVVAGVFSVLVPEILDDSNEDAPGHEVPATHPGA